jgi:hypothetical protein
MKSALNRKAIDLLSLIGACSAAAAIALLLRERLEEFVLPLLFGGLALHAVAVSVRQRKDRGSSNEFSQWERALYWSFWVVLTAVAFYQLPAGSPRLLPN